MKNLVNKILIVIALLLVYRLGTFVPLPGINAIVLEHFVQNNSSGVLGMFNMFTGGALGRMSIFSLNIMPYITASIVFQLLGIIYKEIGEMRKDGAAGKRKLNQYTRYLALGLAVFQGFGLAAAAERMAVNGMNLVEQPGMLFRFVATLSMVGGTAFVIWLTDQISAKGVGNGSSLVIFSGIVAGLPTAMATLFDMGRSGSLSPIMIVLIFAICIGLVMLIVFCERAFRKIPVNYPKRQIGNRLYAGQSTHLPLKINVSGVLAPIFASALLLFPATIINFIGQETSPDSWQYSVLLYLGHGKPLYIALYIALIVFFSFFYTSVVFNPDETADNLKKAGAVVVGRRPGTQTSDYLDSVLTKLTIIGATYLSFICVMPEILIAHYSIPFYLGGTSLLIVINVVIELFQQIQTHTLGKQYQNMLQKRKGSSLSSIRR